MKNLSLFAICLLLAVGCKMNPSKEARIDKLETEMELALEKINQLENQCDALENANKELEARVVLLKN